MGDLFGERQSGVPTFRVADPIRDEALSDEARVAAERVLAEDPELNAPKNLGILKVLSERYARAVEMLKDALKRRVGPEGKVVTKGKPRARR